MGILNVTPDSFSDGNELATVQAVVDRASAMISAGADVLDLGGESTRPGAWPVTATEESDRVLPALAAIRQAWPQVPVSIDTYKAEVAEAAIRAGADIVNDVWGLTYGLSASELTQWLAIARNSAATTAEMPAVSGMAEAVAALRCPVIAMHNRASAEYTDFWPDLLLDLQASLALAEAAGIPRRQIWLDPGFGFVKSVAQNLAVVRDLGRVAALGYPVLLGTSRKSTLGRVLGADVGDRLDATGATIIWGIQQGCAMVRVHDVAEMRRFVRMADALKSGLEFSP